MTRQSGILEVVLHTDGGPFLWGADDNDTRRISDAFLDIANDPENRVVILTGTGDSFCESSVPAHSGRAHNPDTWEHLTFRFQRQLHQNLLDIEVPIVAAVNGPFRIHSELALMCDVVLATPETVFQDRPHLPAGVVPGDGVHLVWSLLIGRLRANHFVLTGAEITAEEAMRLGCVNEVIPKETLLERARAIARVIANAPPLTVRYTRRVMNMQLRDALAKYLEPSLALEGLAQVQTRGWRSQYKNKPPEWVPPVWEK
jgi:enoyl-CoA hydratase/carnithine racemase